MATYTKVTELDGHLRLLKEWVQNPEFWGVGKAPQIESMTQAFSTSHIVPKEATPSGIEPNPGYGIGPEGHFKITVEFTPAP